MITVGLTGSIGMGKSTTAKFFSDAGAYHYDADAAVHELYKGRAVAPIEEAFPGTIKEGQVNRKQLAKRIIENPDALKILESIVHPLVAQEELRHRTIAREARYQIMILDIPLLFENGGGDRVDKIVVVTTDPQTQKARVLARPGMTEEKFQTLLAKQMPDSEKREKADFLVDTSFGLAEARRQVEEIMTTLLSEKGVQ